MAESTGTRAGAARSAEHWIVLALAVLAPLALVAMGIYLVPSPAGHGTHEQLGLPPCRAIQWFGVPCPGCGVTTSVTLAAHGRFVDALATQPFGLIVFATAAVAPAWAAWGAMRGRDLFAELTRLTRRRTWIAFAALLGAAWIYKIAITLAP